MKLNIRSVAIFATLGVVAAANAGNLSFFLAYGDSTFAGLNGKNVGDAMSTTSVNFIPRAAGATYTVQLWALNSGPGLTYADGFSSGNLFVGYDNATSVFKNYGSDAAGQAAANSAAFWKKISVATAMTNPGIVNEVKSNNTPKVCTPGPCVMQSQSTGFYTSALASDTATSSLAGLRSVGLGNAVTVNAGDHFVLPTGSAVRLYDLTITNLVNMSTTKYGPLGSGNGLTLNNFTGADFDNNGFNNNFLNGSGAVQSRGDGLAYTIGVPEPSSVVVIVMGAALLRRRRK